MQATWRESDWHINHCHMQATWRESDWHVDIQKKAPESTRYVAEHAQLYL